MIIVTGGAGFIGSNLVAGLQARGLVDIVVCDRMGDSDKWKNLAKRELRDVVHPDRLFDYLYRHADKISAIFHMGAISSTTETDVDLIIDTNFVTTRRLWKWCGINGVRFIYASSAATYGTGEHGFRDDESPKALEKLRPLNPYGWSKHLFDRRALRIAHGEMPDEVKEKIPPQWAGLKFFNVYGPNEYHKGEQMSVACKLYPQVIAGAAARLFKSNHPDFTDGGQLRDFIHVEDCVKVMLWFLDNPDKSGLFNVGTGKGRSFNDLATAVFTAAGKPPKINYVDMPQALQDRYQNFTEADMSKLRAAGYKEPFLELEEGVRRYVQDYLAAADQYV